MGALPPTDTLTASASGSDVSPASAALRVAIWREIAGASRDRPPCRNVPRVSGQCAYSDSRTCNGARLPVNGVASRSRGVPTDSRKGLSQRDQARWRPEGAIVNAAAPLPWCLPLFRSWHVLGQKGRAKQIGSTRNGAEPLLTSLPTSRIAPASTFANLAGGRYAIVLELGGLRRPTCGRSL